MDPDDLRYADCPPIAVEQYVASSAERVWALISDIQLPARFSEEFQGAEWVDGWDGPGLGARFVGRNSHPAIGEWETTSTVTDWDPLRLFGWAVGDPQDPATRWRFAVSDDGEGVKVTMWMKMGPARSGLNLAIDARPDKEAKIVRNRLEEHRANMQATLAGIKEIAEAAPAG